MLIEKERCRVPLPVERYKEIMGRIVSKQEGELRKRIDAGYALVDNRFIKKDRLQEIIESKSPPIGIAAKDPSEESDELKNWLSTNSGFIEGRASLISGDGKKNIIFSNIQRYMMDCRERFLFVEKCRQYGFSFLIAARSLAKSMILSKSTSISVSYNEEESKEKIVYARELYESLPRKWQLARRLKYDNKTSLVFEKIGGSNVETRIIAFPQRIIRGKGGGVDIYLDELAHCIHARKIYTSAIPVMSRGEASIWIGSTPAGKDGLFYEISSNKDNLYPLFLKLHIPWWLVPEFCKNVVGARKEAYDMMTDQRVTIFATENLKQIRNSMTLEDFQQEYECVYIDEKYSYFPWELIYGCVPLINDENIKAIELDSISESAQTDKERTGTGIKHYTDFDSFYRAYKIGLVKGPFLGGFDVGRTIDASEVIFMQEDPKTHNQTVLCNITMKNTKFEEQKVRVKEMVDALGPALHKFGVDNAGIGMDIAENLESKYYDLVERLPFNNNAWKEEACKRMKYRMELKKISLPLNRAFLSQIHSIKRELLASGVWRFAADRNENKHHGDKFWAMVAASEMGYPVMDSDIDSVRSFDQRIFKGIDKKDEGKKRSGIILPVIPNVMKFNPYNNQFANNLLDIPAPTNPLVSYSNFTHLSQEVFSI